MKIFVALSTFAESGDAPLELLKEGGFSFTVNPTGKRLTAEQVAAMTAGFDGVVAGLEPYTSAVLRQLPGLRCISRCGVGVDNIDLAAAAAEGIAVRNTPDVVIQPVAELTVGMIFDLLRNLTAHTKLMNEGRWERLPGFLLKGKQAGIIGLGRIGRRVAEMLTALGVTVLGYDLAPDREWARSRNIRLVSLETLLSGSDIVSLHLSPSAEQPFVLSTEELSEMKPGSFIVNTARGSLIDEDALIKALTGGPLAGAALDVYAKEPYAGPLSRLPNVVLTPHVATLTRESRCEMETQAVRNVIEELTGKNIQAQESLNSKP